MSKESNVERQANKANRLINETSTYLLQHAYNPVDWYPWGEEAISRARAEDKPIMLSVGYSACHWCHVMEHESFEDSDTARLMNSLFINIKVDREERPDIDEIYMKAVQMLTGHGGWPMTVFLTPELKPFFGGTYFPPVDRHGMPSFKKLLVSVAQAWEDQRDNIEESSAEITQHLSMLDKVPTTETTIDHTLVERALDRLARVFDQQCGGFGNAPKFPHTGSISLAMRHSSDIQDEGTDLQQICNSVMRVTLDKMAYGGIHDQIGGGFARYAVDRIWLVPHFEKMLYDNALLCRNYLEGYQLTGREYWKRVGAGILEFVEREMTSPEGAFYSSLDADSEGEEGKYYVWTPKEVLEILGKDEGEWLCEIYGVNERGNFEHGTSVLHLVESPETLCTHYGMTLGNFWRRVDSCNQKLLAVRERRVHPGRDEKILTSWNSLMISAFVDGYKVLRDRKYLEIAKRAAQFILANLYSGDHLLRTWGRGIAKLNGYLDDYSYFAQALLDLASVDFNPQWYHIALELNSYVLEHFSDKANGTFYYTSDNHEQLIARTKSFYDASTPSPTSVAVSNLLRLSRLSGDEKLAERAAQVMSVYAAYFERVPDQFSYLLCDLDFYLAPPTEVAIVVRHVDERAEQMVFAAHTHYSPNAVYLLKSESTAGAEAAAINSSPLMQDRSSVDGKATVYMCENFVCDKPITDLNDLEGTVENHFKQRLRKPT